MKLDLVTWVFLGLVSLSGILYTSFELTPSSYGALLLQIGAPEYGPVAGTARYIRSDEWAFSTSSLQAAVRNGFRRVNETSFYQEDLRGASVPLALPLQDWGLIFKPELWAFFVVPPPIAFSAYFATLMCGCLAGYQLVFRQLGVDPLVAAAVSVLIFFCGFTQFWWTTFAPLVAGFPWILLILFSSLAWWKKALLYSWALPVWALACFYPGLIADLAFASVVLVLAIRPSLFRSLREMAAVAIGGIAMVLVVYLYFIDVIPIMRNTVYPGHRIAVPGTATVLAVASQFYPYISFAISGYRNLAGLNICEIGAVGSFLPLLTLCLTRFDVLRNDQAVRRALVVFGIALALLTCWEITDAPRLLGRIFLWDQGPSTRLLLPSGLVITFAAVFLWARQLITLEPFRILIFAMLGPVASVVLKRGSTMSDYALAGLIAAAALVACVVPAKLRAAVILSSIALTNIYAFGRFNPLQPAEPIFETPDTDVVRELHKVQDASPDHFIADPRFVGGTLNGMGLRSVSHALPVPKLEPFHKYFPNMDPEQFNQVFNRCCYIQVTADRLPNSSQANLVNVPFEAVDPVRNLRQVMLEVAPHKDCSIQRGGLIDKVRVEDGKLIIDGWAPWEDETSSQALRVVSARVLRAEALLTVRRPDVAEIKKDYAFARAGFRLTVSSADGKAPSAEEIVLVALNTSQGLAQVTGCGCP